MKFNFEIFMEKRKEKLLNKVLNKKGTSFAWLPIKLTSGEFVWLEKYDWWYERGIVWNDTAYKIKRLHVEIK